MYDKLLQSLALFASLGSIASFVKLTRQQVRLSQSIYSSQSSLLMQEVFHNIIAIIPESNTLSNDFKIKPYKKLVSWHEVLQQVNVKLGWESLGNVSMGISNYNSFINSENICGDIAMLIGFDSINGIDIDKLKNKLSAFDAVAVFDSHYTVMKLENYGDYSPAGSSEILEAWIDDNLFKTSARRKQRLAYQIAIDAWARKSSDDILFLVLVLLDTYSIPIPSVRSATNTDNTGLPQLSCMVSNCADEMIQCFSNPLCRAALDCLNKCRGNDQVCAYRCITSYETIQFENFARCILQRHNCMGNSALMPKLPNPDPMTTFRGQPLTFETAWSIFEGHVNPRPNQGSLLDTDKFSYVPQSWLVVCGQNPAYDYFSCQHQIFYRDVNNSSILWYDPVFKVVTLDGREVWRRRHYRVKKAKTPGTFSFSVLDNGVVSNEFWRILDCADDLSWGIFYYSGAASAAGTNYRGALIVSRDGKWPTMTDALYIRMELALARGGIKMWEMFEVSNVNCSKSAAGAPPLGYE